MAEPLVTVICPTYNRSAMLQCALRSVLNQDFPDFELRVMGDGCTDDSERMVAALADPRIVWFNFPRNTGSQSEPNNEGLRRARGRYVAFIGHDDLWFPWHLSRLVKHIQSTDADLVHDLVASVGTEGIEGVYGPPHERSGYTRVYFPTSSWLHRRELPHEVGFWRNPDELSWAIDYDFSRRVAEAGKKISFLQSLGVLKFHSQVWKCYALKGEPPEKWWLDEILQKPDQLKDRVLIELATLCAPHFQAQDKKPLGLAWDEATFGATMAVRATIRDVLALYGLNRWPVGDLLRARMKRLRLRQRSIRGLPPA